MKMEDMKKIVKAANQLHKMKLYLRPTTGSNVKLWIYCKYQRQALDLPALQASPSTKPLELALLKRAIAIRDKMEDESSDGLMSSADRSKKLTAVSIDWSSQYAVESSRNIARMAIRKFVEANGDIAVGMVSRQGIIKTMDAMKRQGAHVNTVRKIASTLRAFCNWAEQRGYMDRVDTRKLLPPEAFGEVKALSEEELKALADTPLKRCPDIKDMFFLGVYTAQRMGEIREYTFQMLHDKQIKAMQGKTGKFIVIPLSEAALGIMESLKQRRQAEGMGTAAKDKMFNLPTNVSVLRIFKEWLELAGIPRDRISPHNSRSTAITLLIKKGVSESVTQELANHASPAITARYYRQIDTEQKKEALDRIPTF
jgi:integrase/recombinase XerD